MVLLPTGVLRNSRTGRYHPIPFGPAPRPGRGNERGNSRRYKSVGLHAAGFDTIEQAREYIARRGAEGSRRWVDVGTVWDWDGSDMSARIEFFDPEALPDLANIPA
jgi:hypothetical protein